MGLVYRFIDRLIREENRTKLEVLVKSEKLSDGDFNTSQDRFFHCTDDIANALHE